MKCLYYSFKNILEKNAKIWYYIMNIKMEDNAL